MGIPRATIAEGNNPNREDDEDACASTATTSAHRRRATTQPVMRRRRVKRRRRRVARQRRLEDERRRRHDKWSVAGGRVKRMRGGGINVTTSCRTRDLGWQCCRHFGDMSARQPNVGTFGRLAYVVPTQNLSRHNIFVLGVFSFL